MADFVSGGECNEIYNRAPKVFQENRLGSLQRQAIYMNWDALSRLSARLLTGLLGRPIEALAVRERQYHWCLHFRDTKLELYTLFKAIGAKEGDFEDGDFDRFPDREIDESLCNKLIGQVLPFRCAATFSDGNGVWFISGPESAKKEGANL